MQLGTTALITTHLPSSAAAAFQAQAGCQAGLWAMLLSLHVPKCGTKHLFAPCVVHVSIMLGSVVLAAFLYQCM